MNTNSSPNPSPLRARLVKHFADCALVPVAAVAVAAAAPASAAVTYSGLMNFVCAVDIDGAYLNAQTSVLSNGPGSGVPGWDINPYSSAGGMNFFNSTGGGQMRIPGVTTGPAGNLPPGTEVGPTGSYNTSTTNVFTSPVANWQYSAQNIIGFRFVAAAGTTHYGWMRFDMGAPGSSGTSMTRTMVDYSWETTPGASIFATAGAPDAVPEPTSVLYTLLAFSGGLLRRRRGKVSV